MKILLGGNLMMYSPENRASFEIDLDGPTTLFEVLEMLHVPYEKAQIVIVNQNLVDKYDMDIEDEDEVFIYPVLDGG